MLSQGEKHRLSVASILTLDQKVLLLDEPTFGQDKRNQRQLMDLMQQLTQNGVGILMVSHHMETVYQYCTRIILLIDGRIRYDGEPESLFSNASLCSEGRLEKPFWFAVEEYCREAPEKNYRRHIRSAEDAYKITLT
jgi:energy-coupling factor transport system ATP-binding protein